MVIYCSYAYKPRTILLTDAYLRLFSSNVHISNGICIPFRLSKLSFLFNFSALVYSIAINSQVLVQISFVPNVLTNPLMFLNVTKILHIQSSHLQKPKRMMQTPLFSNLIFSFGFHRLIPLFLSGLQLYVLFPYDNAFF